MLIVLKICYLSGDYSRHKNKNIVQIIQNSDLSHFKASRLNWKHVNDEDFYNVEAICMELWETQQRQDWL